MDKEMKMSCTRTNMDMLHSLVVLCLIYSAYCTTGLVNGLTITLNKNAVRDSDLKIFISTSSITFVVILYKPDTSSENCAAPILGPGLCTTPDLTQDFTTNVTTYSISSLVRSRDEGIWTATHGGSDSNTTDIKVLTIPTLNVTQTVSALTLSSSNTQTLTITATCAYPAVLLDLYFVPTGGGTAVLSTSSTSSCTNSSSACADTDAQDYTCDIVPKLEASLSAGTYNMLVVVNLVGQYEPIGLNATITDTELTVIGTPTPLTTTHVPPVCSCSWLPCGWKCHYLYIIIVAVVVIIVLVVVVVGYRYRRGYFGKNKEEDRKKSYTNKAFDKNETENGQPTDSPKHTAL